MPRLFPVVIRTFSVEQFRFSNSDERDSWTPCVELQSPIGRALAVVCKPPRTESRLDERIYKKAGIQSMLCEGGSGEVTVEFMGEDHPPPKSSVV